MSNVSENTHLCLIVLRRSSVLLLLILLVFFDQFIVQALYRGFSAFVGGNVSDWGCLQETIRIKPTTITYVREIMYLETEPDSDNVIGQ
jgi:hypothetical protein